MGESWVVESLVGDAGEAVVGVMGESGASGRGVAHRGRFLEFDVDAAAGGAFDGLLGLVVEVVAQQAAVGRPHGVGWATREQGPARPTRLAGGRGLGPRGAGWRAASIACGWAAVGTCGRVFASGARFWKDQGRRYDGTTRSTQKKTRVSCRGIRGVQSQGPLSAQRRSSLSGVDFTLGRSGRPRRPQPRRTGGGGDFD